MRDEREIVQHMQDIEKQTRERNGDVFYVACRNTKLDFVDEPDGAYSKVEFCSFVQVLDEQDAEAARLQVADMNTTGKPCPLCGKKANYTLYTEDDFVRRRQFCVRNLKKLRR